MGIGEIYLDKINIKPIHVKVVDIIGEESIQIKVENRILNCFCPHYFSEEFYDHKISSINPNVIGQYKDLFITLLHGKVTRMNENLFYPTIDYSRVKNPSAPLWEYFIQGKVIGKFYRRDEFENDIFLYIVDVGINIILTTCEFIHDEMYFGEIIRTNGRLNVTSFIDPSKYQFIE